MKTTGMALFFLLIVLPCGAQQEPTPRDQYMELYRSGRLDRLADSYVCFLDLPDTFMTFGEGDQIGNHLKKMGEFEALPLAEKNVLKPHSLLFRFYQKGIPDSERGMMTKDHASTTGHRTDVWTSETRDPDEKGYRTRNTFSIDWRTMQSAFLTWTISPDPPPPSCQGPHCVQELRVADESAGNRGRCEKIPTRVRQHGPKN